MPGATQRALRLEAERASAAPAQALLSVPPSRIAQVVQLHHGFLCRSLRNLGVHDGDVEDAAQQVLMVLARKLDSVRPGSERAFLFQTAVRIASRHHRTLRRRREVPGDETEGMPSEERDPEAALARSQQRRMLDVLLAALPMECRSVVVLFEIEELALLDIAELVGAPLGTVKTRLRRGRHLLLDAAKRSTQRGSIDD